MDNANVAQKVHPLKELPTIKGNFQLFQFFTSSIFDQLLQRPIAAVLLHNLNRLPTVIAHKNVPGSDNRPMLLAQVSQELEVLAALGVNLGGGGVVEATTERKIRIIFALRLDQLIVRLLNQNRGLINAELAVLGLVLLDWQCSRSGLESFDLKEKKLQKFKKVPKTSQK